MKTLIIAYVLLSVLVVLFSWIVNVELKKQIATLRKTNEANVAEIKSRMEEINALTNALAKSKETDERTLKLLKDSENTIIAAKKEIDDTNNLITKYAKAHDDLSDIIEILLKRHGYDKLEGFDDTIEVDKMLEFIKNNDTSKKRSRKKSKDEDRPEECVDEIK